MGFRTPGGPWLLKFAAPAILAGIASVGGPPLLRYHAPVVHAGLAQIGGPPLLRYGSPESASFAEPISGTLSAGRAAFGATLDVHVDAALAADAGAASFAGAFTADPIAPLVIAWRDSLADLVSLTASSSETEWPVSNLRKNPPSRMWRSGSNSASIDFQCHGAPPFQMFCIVNTTLKPDATVQLLLSNVQSGDGDVYDSGAFSAATKEGYPNVYWMMPAEKTARFGRIVLTNPNQGDVVAAGFLFAGPCWMPVIPDAPGRELAWTDFARSAQSHAGEPWVGPKALARAFTFELPFMAAEEALGQAMDLALRNGIARSAIVMLDRARFPQELSMYGVISAADPLVRTDAVLMARRFVVRERI